ncbi:TatD family deoxyribonuclease [Blastococcus sp. MG754426]|uniref:TatD family hydrolase n=1 Tax=unclassified Blastococcus TaxID=2619396 RepID=UPI001EF010B3|nr:MULTISPECIES: TatD family hydrolase [unclassified Blastococcus]MCF6509026.1 TatD family deoxyribonuclease [Blastococcus sp. MG754426]MCF6513613.1 TatD family deoxyribonuclease [Blastococcus sp. MG754427]MCF6734609.1 TatD family deoxyribonuclease [Blastococcus sp. KM273129]
MSRSAASRANRRGEPPPSPEPLPAPAVDSHTHLDIVLDGFRPEGGPTSTDADVDAEIAAAVAVTVPRLVQVGVDVASSRWSAELAARHANVLAAVAVHPNEAGAGEADDAALAEIDRLAALPRVRAVGETGLDRYRTGPEGWAAQEASFREHIRIAKRHGVALVVHDRDAHDEVLRVVDDEGAPGHVVMHCFSGDAAFARACVERGFVLSFAGTLTFGNAGYLREAAALTPLDQLLVETDSPFLTPAPHRGRPNASRLVPHTVRALAEVTGTDLTRLCDALTTTAERVFGPWQE